MYVYNLQKTHCLHYKNLLINDTYGNNFTKYVYTNSTQNSDHIIITVEVTYGCTDG